MCWAGGNGHKPLTLAPGDTYGLVLDVKQQQLTMQPASYTQAGTVTTGVQTFKGPKTFKGTTTDNTSYALVATNFNDEPIAEFRNDKVSLFYGKVLVGSTTVSTFTLDVNGPTLLKSSGTSISIINTGIELNATLIGFNGGVSSSVRIENNSNLSLLGIRGRGQVNNHVLNYYSTHVIYSSETNSATANNYGLVTFLNKRNITGGFYPTEGNANYHMIAASITINQTGTANGITRGLWLDPEILNAYDYRAVEYTNNAGWGLYGVGTARNYLAGKLQIGSTTDIPSAILQLSSTTQGFAPPRMFGSQAEAIASPLESLLVYSLDGSGSVITSKGWWGFDGSTWVKLN